METLICSRVKRANGKFVYSPAYEFGVSTAVAINNDQLRNHKFFKSNPRLQLWIEFLTKGVLDLDDPIQNKIYQLYLRLKADKEWYEMVKEEPSKIACLIGDTWQEAKEEGIVEGRAEGIIEGRAEGIIEGRAEGIIEGRVENSIEIAVNLLDVLDDATIATKTNLSLEQVVQLRAEHS